MKRTYKTPLNRMKFETLVQRIKSGKYGYRLTRFLNGQLSFNVKDQRFDFKPI